MIERARVLSSGTVKDLEAIAAQQLQVGFIGESHQSLREALLRSEVVPLPGDYSGIDDVIAGSLGWCCDSSSLERSTGLP